MLKERLRHALIDQARTGTPTTYKELADRLELEPPQTIHRLGEALEALMKGDVAADRPMLAALCVSKIRPGIPARAFFLAAQVLGVFSGDPTGPEARAFHADELQRVLSVDASVMEADASRYHGRAPDEIDWSAPERRTRAVDEFLAALDDEDPNAERFRTQSRGSRSASAWRSRMSSIGGSDQR
jgi:hypothetical protein